ncbi:MAG: glycosyltransferase [Ruminococcus flavefaciens]|nr:glycosyltransferase [Ruminococcus flavefaciens]
MKRDHIVYIPYMVKSDRINEYVSNMIKILEEKYQVKGGLAYAANLLQMLRTKAVFLNWVEDELDSKMKLQLLLHKMFGVKIIWVFHNKYPHDKEYSDRIVKNMEWLADYSSIIMLLSRNSRRFIPHIKRNARKACYIPHILYDTNNDMKVSNPVRKNYGIGEEDFLFTIFGSVKPYKNIEKAIEVFQNLNLNHAKMLIVGKAADNKYAKKIKGLCMGNEDIILDLQFISSKYLEQIIEASDVIVMPYKDISSMNSGVMIHTFSLGRTVIAPDICMARDFMSERFLYVYKNSLEKAMKKAYTNGRTINHDMGRRAKTYMEQHNNEEFVKQCIYDMIGNKNQIEKRRVKYEKRSS